MTMPELAITLAIAGLLALTAAPMIRTTLRRYALEEASQRFTADLVQAQTLAIKLNRAVTVQRVGLTGYRVDGGPTRAATTERGRRIVRRSLTGRTIVRRITRGGACARLRQNARATGDVRAARE